jgi:hypothetical protein
MRIALALAILTTSLSIASASPSHAADVGRTAADPCRGTTQKKVACLEEKYAVVVAELKETRQSVAGLRDSVSALKDEVASLKKSAQGTIHFGDKVQLQSLVHSGVCLDHNTHNAGHIQGWGCGAPPAQAWRLNSRN